MEILIDEIDKDLLEISWYIDNDGYWRRSHHYRDAETGARRLKSILLHRLILARIAGRDLTRKEATDHINGVRHDNRRLNLRIATWQQNLRNRTVQSNNRSGLKGVTTATRPSGKKRYYASIHYRGRKISLGGYKTPEEAAEAYKKAAEKYFGEFAHHLNIPPK